MTRCERCFHRWKFDGEPAVGAGIALGAQLAELHGDGLTGSGRPEHGNRAPPLEHGMVAEERVKPDVGRSNTRDGETASGKRRHKRDPGHG